MPDFRYRQTTAALDVRGFEFRASGCQPIDLSWPAAFPDWQSADETGDNVQLHPTLRNEEIAQLKNLTIEATVALQRRHSHRCDAKCIALFR